MNNKTIYIIIIIFLLVTNVVTVISARKYSIRQEEDTRPVIDQPQEIRMGYFMNTLGISQNQMPEFRRFNMEYNREVSEINRDLMLLRNRIISEISTDDRDEEQLDSVLNDFGAGHIRMKRATIMYYENLKSICNEEQKEELEIFFRNMLDPQGPIYTRGQGRGRRGMGMGPGRGRQNIEGGRQRGNGPGQQ